jgi:penicillin-binding protein 1C
VWLGDPAARPLGAVSGFEAAAPAAARILQAAIERASDDGVAPVERDVPRLSPIAICAQTGLRPGPRCSHVVEERFAPGSVPSEPCEAHDERRDVMLPARYASWIERTHPPGVAGAPRARRGRDEHPAVREPRDGARWLLDPTTGTIDVPLRASVGGVEVADASFEVDGAPVAGSRLDATPGDHEIVAVWRGKRSRAARVHVGVAGAR